MPYLQKDDYTISIPIEHLNEVLAEGIIDSGKTDDQVRETAEQWAIDIYTWFVQGRYDIAVEFAKISPDTARKIVVINCIVDLALYQIHTISPRNIPAWVQKNYDQCIEMLKMIADGSMDLVGVPEVENPIAGTELKSNCKFISKPFTDSSLQV